MKKKNIHIQVKKLAEGKYKDDADIQSVYVYFKVITYNIQSILKNATQWNVARTSMLDKYFEGDDGYYLFASGVDNEYRTFETEIYSERRAYTEILSVLVSLLNNRGEKIVF